MIDAATRRRFLERVLVYQRAGVAQQQARRAAANELNLPLSLFDQADADVLEKTEQVEVRRLAIQYGFTVRNLSQYRASKVARGIGDLYLTHKRQPIALWWETKRQVGGRLSSDQEAFRGDCLRCGVGYGNGDRFAFVDKLIELELAVRGAGQYGIDPAPHALTSLVRP